MSTPGGDTWMIATKNKARLQSSVTSWSAYSATKSITYQFANPSVSRVIPPTRNTKPSYGQYKRPLLIHSSFQSANYRYVSWKLTPLLTKKSQRKRKSAIPDEEMNQQGKN